MHYPAKAPFGARLRARLQKRTVLPGGASHVGPCTTPKPFFFFLGLLRPLECARADFVVV
jgi:hypothetical protein